MTDTETPSLGHNAPPSDINQQLENIRERIEPVRQRINDLRVGVARAPRIDHDDTAARAAEQVAQCKNALKEAEKARKAEKRPFDEAAKAVQSEFKQIMDPLSAEAHQLEQRIGAYWSQRAAERRRQAKAMADEALARAATEHDKADAMRKEGQRMAEQATTDEQRSEAAAMLERADRMQAKARETGKEAITVGSALNDAGRLRGDYGATGYLRTEWVVEVIDPDQVPREYMTIDTTTIKKDARAHYKEHGEYPEIPGVRVYQTEKFQVKGG